MQNSKNKGRRKHIKYFFYCWVTIKLVTIVSVELYIITWSNLFHIHVYLGENILTVPVQSHCIHVYFRRI